MALTEAVDADELAPFDERHDLFLKPIAKIVIVVKLPQVKIVGQSISNWDLMEKLKKAIVPYEMQAIRVRESSLEQATFEAELASRSIMKEVLRRFDSYSMKVSGYADALKVRASEAACDFPTRTDWDMFFLKNKLDESRPGERPDTIHLAKLPINWFSDGITDHPSERLLRSAMENFGEVRAVDIPVCDPVRHLMASKISGIQSKGLGFGQELYFEAYVQYDDYAGFSKAMSRLRGMKWIKRAEGRFLHAHVKVDYDRSRHLSAVKMALRDKERVRMVAEQRRLTEEQVRKRQDEEARRLAEEMEKEKRREEREHRRKMKAELKRRRAEEEAERRRREKQEAQEARIARQAEARRLLHAVFHRIEERESRQKRAAEIRLRCVLDGGEPDDLIPAVEGEGTLRESLLRQQEERMRQRLLEKMAAAKGGAKEKEKKKGKDKKEKKRKRSREEKEKRRKRSRD